MGIVVAWLWGLAEATLFFIVPDVWLTRLALNRPLRYALLAALAAAGGALLGGVVMVAWSGVDAASVQTLLQALPAVSPQMAETVRRELADSGAMALLSGSFEGIPYKLYAAYVLQSGVPLWLFFLATIPVRLVRLVLVVLLAKTLAEWLRPYLGQPWIVRLWAGFWLVFYAIFWWIMPG